MEGKIAPSFTGFASFILPVVDEGMRTHYILQARRHQYSGPRPCAGESDQGFFAAVKSISDMVFSRRIMWAIGT